VIGDQPIGAGLFSSGGAGSGSRSGDFRQGIGRKGPFAMQLVQQRLEFVVGDVGAGGGCRRWRLGRWRNGVGRELAFAVQLIEQGFEFCVGNIFAGRHSGRCRRSVHLRRFGFGLDRIEGVEQLLELAVGDIRLSFDHRLRRGFNHRRRRGVGRFCQARQGGQQFRRGGGDRGTFAHFAEHAVDRIQCFENHVH